MWRDDWCGGGTGGKGDWCGGVMVGEGYTGMTGVEGGLVRKVTGMEG